jgi:hypothetical protein
VVVVLASNPVDVQGNTSGESERLEQVGDHLGRHYHSNKNVSGHAGIQSSRYVRSPIFSRVKGKWQTKYGLDEISMTARERAFQPEGISICLGVLDVNATAQTYLIQGRIRGSVSLDTPSFA